MYYYSNKGITNFKRTLTDREIADFFTIMESERDYLFFMLQLIMACRIEEVVKIQINDLDFINCKIALTPNKQRSIRARRFNVDIPPDLMQRLFIYCQNERHNITYAQGYIFAGRTKKKQHISVYHMRDRFNHYRDVLGLTEQHALTKDGVKRPYVRPHTLRATSINKIIQETNGNVILSMQHSRHKTLNGFMPYLEEYEQQKLKKIRNKAFDKLTAEREIIVNSLDA